MSAKRPSFAVLRPYVHGLGVFVQRLPALISCGVLLAIAWFNLGDAYNVPAVLWLHSDHPLTHAAMMAKQFLNGIGVALLFGYVWLVTFVVEVRLRGRHDVAAIAPEPPGWVARVIDWLIPESPNADDFSQRMRLYFALTWLPLLAAMAVPTFCAFSSGSPFVSCPLDRRWPFLAGLVVTYAGVAFAAWLSRDRWPANRGRSTRTLAFVLFFVLLGGYAFWCYVVGSEGKWRPGWLYGGNYLPPVVSLCVLFGVLTGLAGGVWYVLRRRAPWGFLALAVLFFVCNSYPYKLRFDSLDYDNLLSLTDAEEPEAPPAGAKDLPAPPVADDARPAEERLLAAGCARLHALLFSGQPPERFDGRPYEELFPRYRKLQLILVSVNLDRQLDPARPPADPAGLDRLGYAELFTRYRRKLRDEIRTAEEQRFLAPWRKNLATADGAVPAAYKPRLAVLAVTGGANRSAFWVTVALDRLDRELKGEGVPEGESRFPRHLRLITGASGGMVGASHYVSTLDDRGRHVVRGELNGSWQTIPGPDGHPIPANLLGKFDPVTQVDYLTPVMNRMVFRDVPAAFLPTRHFRHDRGQTLEGALDGTTHEMEQPFAALRAGEEAGWRPSMAFSPMLVEDGRRLLISNLPLAYVASSSGALLLGDTSPSSRPGVRRSQYAKGSHGEAGDDPPWKDVYARSAVELLRLFPDAADKFQLSTAARMNATFPYISPAVDLPTDPPRRVVDAGYFDNYGIDVAAGWVYHHRRWLKENTSGVVVIQLRDGRSNTRRRQLFDPDEASRSWLSRGLATSLQWLFGPLDGAGAAYVGVSSFRNDEHLQSLSDSLNADLAPGADHPFFTTVVFERPGETGMNWVLDQDKIDVIREGMNGEANQRALEALKQWWGVGH